MKKIFLSYATEDHLFAELAVLKLQEAGFTVWRDKSQIAAGVDWKAGIEEGISSCDLLLLALSATSAQSAYVTFEWAYALGRGKPIVPVRLNLCQVHPRLESIQYLDFSIAGSLPWSTMIERIREIEVSDAEPFRGPEPVEETGDLIVVKKILTYLDQRGYQMASFKRIRRRVDEKLTDDRLDKIVDSHNTVFRHAILKDGEKGLAKLIP